MDEKFAKWKGVDRSKIDWHPRIEKKKCTGCGMCVTTCGRNVFDFDWTARKSVVAKPLQCMVGCTSCEVWCIYDAIKFPDKDSVKNFIKENDILKKAHEDLETFRQI